jgi:hypothetical protein
MTVNWPDELQALDRVGPSRDLWADALARTGSTRPHQRTPDRRFHGLLWIRSLHRRTAVAVSVVLLAAIGAASAVAYHYLGPSPGFSAGLSAFDRLPQATWPSSIPRFALDRSAEAVGITPTEAERRLRLLQTGLTLGTGTTRGEGSLYAFQGSPGTACIFLTGQGGTCVTPRMTNNNQSVMWGVFPGYPGETPAIVALVADNVREVEVDISGVTRSIPVVNNSVYADLHGLTRTATISLIVHFADGTTKTMTAPNPYSG